MEAAVEHYDDIRVLVIDDNPADQVLLREFLALVPHTRYQVEFAGNKREGLEALANHDYQVCLLDYYLGADTGLDLLAELPEVGYRGPVIMLTGLDSPQLDSLAMRSGVSDYLPKQEMSPTLLERTIRYAIRNKETQQRLAELAHYDNLTGLVNRRLFTDRLQHALSHAARKNGSLAVFFLDLDRFKQLNDTLGHDAGDQLLRGFARRVSGQLRAADTFARFGGDEFVALLEDVNKQDAELIAEKILAATAEPFRLEEHPWQVTPSIGIALYPEAGEDADSLLHHADTALYQAKQEGRATYRFYTPEFARESDAQQRLEQDLRQSLANSALELDYQIQRDLHSGQIVGVEAYIRWPHASRGRLGAGEILPLAERLGLTRSIGEFVLCEACRQLCRWFDQLPDHPDLKMTVNLAPSECCDDQLVSTVERVLQSTGLAGPHLRLDLTETTVMQDPDQVIPALERLHELGVELVLDDFGTDAFNLSYLGQLRLDALKIDLPALRQRNADLRTIRSLIALGQSLQLRLVGEGVETEEQLEMLRGLGCDEAQGNYLAQPVGPEQCLQLLQRELTPPGSAHRQ